ncbi:MATE family efflux transporter [Spongiactinospora rosea]|uniref:MATE family efflux transporter n=1 Tax=Spongiactinospora rosea TaxID=2248750 RepID=UPI0013148045|nr:MATE family efflux transporter [Spongiactinospora rosea]
MTAPAAGPSVGRLWALAVPLLVAGLTQIIVNLVDTVLLGRLSTEALGAFALAAPVYLVALVVVRGWATAVQVLVAREHGAGRPGSVARVVRVGLLTSIVVGAGIGAALYAVAGPTLTLLGAAPELIGPGTGYLRILAPAVPLAAASFVLQSACAGIGVTRASMYHALLVNVVNLPLGVLLIFGAGLGVTGAALATLAATAAGTAFLLTYARSRLPRSGPEPAEDVTRRLWAIGWPEMSTMGLGYLNEALIAGFAARMSTADLAAYRIVDNLLLVVFTALSAAAAPITIMAGQALGAGDKAAATLWRRKGVVLLFVVFAAPAALALLAGPWLLALVTTNPVVADLAWAAVPLAVLSMAPMVPAMAYGSFLRAMGDTRSVMLANAAGDYLMLLPLAWLLGVRAGLGLPGVYVAWIAFGLTLSLILALRVRAHLRRGTVSTLPAA